MTPDQLKTITESALATLVNALDEGQSEQLTLLLRTLARFHRYSLHNVWLIAAQRPTATRVAGFHAWKSVGRSVRRGEKGIAILAPIVKRHAEDASEEEPVVAGFRVAHVFDIAQTDGDPLPELATATGNPGSALERFRAAIVRVGIELTYSDNLGGALGLSRGGAIDILNGLTPPIEFVVLAHEYAHELLHHAGDRPESRDTRELEAEGRRLCGWRSHRSPCSGRGTRLHPALSRRSRCTCVARSGAANGRPNPAVAGGGA